MEVDTDPVPTTTTPPTAAHISSSLLYMRRHATDDATTTAASAAEALATPPSPDVRFDATEGATANAAPAAAVSFGSSDISGPAHETRPPPAKKQRRSRGPAQAARHAAFLASKQRAAADGAQALMETDARGDDGGGV